MTSELFIQNSRLDISSDLSALLTFELDNIRDFSARSTTWSKTIVLPGTANNNKLFGHIFQIGQSNSYDDGLPNISYNFNASKAADCLIFQDHMQTFKGVLRLLQINIYNGRLEYEVSVFGELAGLNVTLSSRLLEDLDFSTYDHTYNVANIISSWNNLPGTGYYYPLIDYGTYSTGKHDWDIRTFRPALYAREYIDKMMTDAGFRWQSDLFDSDRFSRLIVPHNQKTLQSRVNQVLDGEVTTPQIVIDTGGGDPSSVVEWDTFLGGGFSYSGGIFTYIGATTLNINIHVLIQGDRYSPLIGNFRVSLRKNGSLLNTSTFSTSPSHIDYVYETSISTAIATNDTIDVIVEYIDGGLGMLVTVDEAFLDISSAVPAFLPVSYGQTITMNDVIPKNIRQIDFLVSIVKLFNLYVYEDKFDSGLIFIKPYIDYYSSNSSDAVDWTYKMNRDKAIKIKPMSELNARKYEFKWKSDSDYYNDLYRKRYNQGYGDYIYDSLYEFTEQTKSFELVFSSTPLVGYGGEDKIYSTIFKRTGTDTSPVEENTDSNIRLLQTKKITGVTSWDIKDGVSVLTSTTDYGYAGHFDDPDAPSDDLNFGALKELFFTLVSGALNVTQFNVYWSAYMAEITDKDSRLLIGNFYLTIKDILLLDFSKYVWLDGVLFRLVRIVDYNTSRPSDCIVELLKVGNTDYTESGTLPPAPEITSYLLWSDTDQIMLHDDPDEKIKYG